VGLLPVLGAVAIYMLEILVAFIQAFIFAFLTGLFLALLIAHDDHEHAHGGQDDRQAHTPPTLEEFAQTDPRIDQPRPAG
jgi:F-type H+-transporting ATPase subunit a